VARYGGARTWASGGGAVAVLLRDPEGRSEPAGKEGAYD